MSMRLKKIRRLINARELRERMVLAACLVLVVYFLVDMVVVSSLGGRQKSLEGEVSKMSGAITTIDGQIQDMIKNYQDSPFNVKSQEKDSLEREHQNLEKRLKNLSSDLISPVNMAQVLHMIFSQESAVDFISMNRLPTIGITEGEDKESSDPPDELLLGEKKESPQVMGGLKLYKHAFMIEIEGSYFEVIDYLKMLEQLQWKIYWESLEYQVTEYPTANVKFTVYTLSTQEKWIGV